MAWCQSAAVPHGGPCRPPPQGSAPRAGGYGRWGGAGRAGGGQGLGRERGFSRGSCCAGGRLTTLQTPSPPRFARETAESSTRPRAARCWGGDGPFCLLVPQVSPRALRGIPAAAKGPLCFSQKTFLVSPPRAPGEISQTGMPRCPHVSASHNSTGAGYGAAAGRGTVAPDGCHAQKKSPWVSPLTFKFNWGNDGAKLQETKFDARPCLGQERFC